MTDSITKTTISEQRELEKNLKLLKKLEADLVQRELDLATLRNELKAIDLLYIRRVGRRLAQLELIDARITEILARLNPDEEGTQDRAREARRKASETSQRAQEAQAAPEESTRFKPSEKLRTLYREAAKNVHPDLACDEAERETRNQWMAEINAAYSTGDEERLASLLEQWHSSPEAVQGDTLEARIERTQRLITRAKERLRGIRVEMDHLKGTFAYRLRGQMEAAEKAGKDLLEEMAEKIEKQIARKQSLLDDLLKNAPPDIRAKNSKVSG
jgi:hypothetical protein